MHAHEIKCTGSISLTVDGYAGQQTLDHPLLAGHRRDLAQVRHGGHLPRAVLSDDVSVSSAANELARSSHSGTSETTQAEHVRHKCSPADSIYCKSCMALLAMYGLEVCPYMYCQDIAGCQWLASS